MTSETGTGKLIVQHNDFIFSKAQHDRRPNDPIMASQFEQTVQSYISISFLSRITKKYKQHEVKFILSPWWLHISMVQSYADVFSFYSFNILSLVNKYFFKHFWVFKLTVLLSENDCWVTGQIISNLWQSESVCCEKSISSHYSTFPITLFHYYFQQSLPKRNSDSYIVEWRTCRVQIWFLFFFSFFFHFGNRPGAI